MVDVFAGELTMLGEDGWQHGPVAGNVDGVGTITSSDFPGTKAAAFTPDRARKHLLQLRRCPILPKARPTELLLRPVFFRCTVPGNAKENPCSLI
jgi:hypothetical protein